MLGLTEQKGRKDAGAVPAGTCSLLGPRMPEPAPHLHLLKKGQFSSWQVLREDLGRLGEQERTPGLLLL